MGTVNVVKTLSQSVGPVITGALAQSGKFWVSFVVAGILKISYDIGMLVMFVGHTTRERGSEEEHEDEGRDGENERGEEREDGEVVR
jgi:hypothetical protein